MFSTSERARNFVDVCKWKISPILPNRDKWESKHFLQSRIQFSVLLKWHLTCCKTLVPLLAYRWFFDIIFSCCWTGWARKQIGGNFWLFRLKNKFLQFPFSPKKSLPVHKSWKNIVMNEWMKWGLHQIWKGLSILLTE